MQRTGLWGFDSKWALGIWGLLILGCFAFVISASRAYVAEQPPLSNEERPAFYFKAVESPGVHAFYLGHVWLIGIFLHVGRRIATYRSARVVSLVAILLLLLAAGHWVRVQADKKGLFVGRGDGTYWTAPRSHWRAGPQPIRMAVSPTLDYGEPLLPA